MANHQIKIITQEGESVSFDCAPEEDIISAAIRQSIFLMSSCREGGCATCKGECTEGDFEMGKVSAQALPPEEQEEDMVLLCRCYPTEDMVVEVPYTFDRISYSEEGKAFPAEIVELEQVSSNVTKLGLKRADGEKQIKLDSGQYYDLEIPGTQTTRSYSPANIENNKGEMEFLIRILDDGQFSNFLKNDAKVGQSINVKGPSGIFGLVANGFTPRYFVAGGTGLAPILSMVRFMHEWGEPQPCTIYFGSTFEQEVFYVEELTQLASEMDNLTVKICVWKATDSWQGEKGSVVDVLKKDLEALATKPDLYLCGPPGMVDATYTVCEQVGIAKDKIYLEKFLPSVS
ncbi:MAG: 2Fe-2S iron-sulfur cluster binding domain-containing protein [Methyloprofundus sp.]|nr:2Fe-2S iron-sulfur cluster binding domain-containing protein [Methyloprofundus sp.]MDT8424464.1 2Fe-2S iron-sulfur cluster binding domain-containing protein [Methyloprofundus sp.]